MLDDDIKILKPSTENTLYFLKKGYTFSRNSNICSGLILKKGNKQIQITDDSYICHIVDGQGRIITTKIIVE